MKLSLIGISCKTGHFTSFGEIKINSATIANTSLKICPSFSSLCQFLSHLKSSGTTQELNLRCGVKARKENQISRLSVHVLCITLEMVISRRIIAANGKEMSPYRNLKSTWRACGKLLFLFMCKICDIFADVAS